MGVSSSTLRKKIDKSSRMGTSTNTLREKTTQTDPMERPASSSQWSAVSSFAPSMQPYLSVGSRAWMRSLIGSSAHSKVNEMDTSKISFLTDGSLILGREGEKNRIIQLLLSDNFNSGNVTMFCMVAANGIGKTTMVQLICSDKRIEEAFDATLFIGMHENFDEKRLMKEMLESLIGAPCDITEPSILKVIVKDELAGKKLFLVLDSAENENMSFWDNLLCLLSVAAKGSVVFVTSSSWEVANTTRALHWYQLDYLTESDCWLMFQRLAFCGTDPKALPELVEIGMHLITKCARNSLCINMLGGLLSHSVTEGWWRSVLGSDRWDLDNPDLDILPALRVCYEFLPSHLKHCFAYCSLFPKGFIFSKHHLVRLWLAQGFVEPIIGRDVENLGLQCFEELFSRSFFHHSPLHDGKDDKFIMHELVHDLAQYVSKKVCFRSEDCEQIIPNGVHHLSLVPFEYQTVTLNLIIAETTELQSFLVVNKFMFQQGTLSPVLYFMGLDEFLAKLSSLRVMDLSNTDIDELPDSIKLLSNLYYLGINNTKIKSIPQEIGNLTDLHILEANDCYNLAELPENIHVLTNLRRLDVIKEAGFVGIPVGIGKLVNLQSLAAFNVGSDEMHCGIEELKDLNKLKGSLQIGGLENVVSGLDAKEANLKSKGYIEKLSLWWSGNTALIEEDGDRELHETVLENLQPSENLQELVISNYIGSQFPLWIGDSSFSKLVSVILDGCPNCIKLPAFGVLPALRYLSVQRLYGVDIMEVSGFPSLEVLNLWEMYDLKEWPEIEHGDFPSLRTLSINRCPILRSIPCFPSLIELSFHYGTRLPEFPDLSSLESLKIEGSQQIKLLNLPQNLISLKKLEISHCGELLSLEGLSKLTSIEMLKIIQCPKLDIIGWKPNLLKSGDTRKLDLGEEVKAHDSDISEANVTMPKDLPIEEILAKEKLEKDILKQYIERLEQEVEMLEEGRDDKLTDGKMVELEQIISYCKRATKDMEVSLEVARSHLDSLETDYTSLLLKEIGGVKVADEFSCPNEHSIRGTGTSKPFISVFSKKEMETATKNFSDSLQISKTQDVIVYKGLLGKSIVAIKTCSDRLLSYMDREVDILSRLSHQNIVTVIGVCYDPPSIILEYYPNGDLSKFLHGDNSTPHLTWQLRTRIIAETCSALLYLHSNNPPVVHRDIKPMNILLDANFGSKLADFGNSKNLDDDDTTGVQGTFGYLDPEYFRTGRATLKSDIFAFGITILEIVTRINPVGMFDGSGTIRERVEEAFINGGFPLFTLVGDWPLEPVKTLLQLGLRCTDFDSSKRPDIKEIWPVVRSLLKATSLLESHCDQFSTRTMQGPNSSHMFQVSKLKVTKWKEEIEKILVREKHEKDLIEEQIEELRQKMKLLERQQHDGKFSKQKKHEVVQPAPSFEGAPQVEVEVEEVEKLTKEREEASSVSPITEFSFQELEAATQNFSDSLKIGEGGFGAVYKGFLLETAVAIKKIRSPSERGQSEFEQEVAILSTIKHPHLIILFGVCLVPRCLIYEHLPNGSLEDRLACTNNTAPLQWQSRTRIIGEICSALMFLHSTNPRLVIHGDLKPSNILLDTNLVCKLSDFGNSHLVEQFHARTTTIFYLTQPKGTFAYMDPEFCITGKLTPQSDIYAFGIIILRLVTGRPALGIALVVEEALEGDNLQSLVDSSAGEWPLEQAQILAKLGLGCANFRRKFRPDLVSMVWATIKPLLEGV